MEIKVAKTAGFCFGVKRAVEAVYEQAERNDGIQVCTYGPVIHNEEVVRDIKKRGVKVIESEEELTRLSGGVVIIRSHGVPPRIYGLLNEHGITCVDATCPFVRKIHDTVRKESEKGKYIIIIGDKTHPEVQGICGWAKKGVSVIQDEDEARSFSAPAGRNICIVSQTTFNCYKFKCLVDIISEKNYNISIVNTICQATRERQVEAERIAKESDVMIVIGDKHSSNTRKLYEICRGVCENTYYIQTFRDLHADAFHAAKKVGITAGASTPDYIIEEVQKNAGAYF